MILAALLGAALALPAASAAPAPVEPARWLKTYSLSPLKEIWSTELSVRSLRGAVDKAVKAVEKSGGELTQPVSSFPSTAQTQQLSFRLTRGGADRALRSLGRLGHVGQPRKSVPPNVTPVGEVRDKRLLLQRERDAHKPELAAMPVLSDLLEEELSYLERVEAATSQAKGEILLDLTIEEKK